MVQKVESYVNIEDSEAMRQFRIKDKDQFIKFIKSQISKDAELISAGSYVDYGTPHYTIGISTDADNTFDITIPLQTIIDNSNVFEEIFPELDKYNTDIERIAVSIIQNWAKNEGTGPFTRKEISDKFIEGKSVAIDMETVTSSLQRLKRWGLIKTTEKIQNGTLKISWELTRRGVSFWNKHS